jgi:hypothetical protein
MNAINENFTVEDILTGLYKMASRGAADALNIDLAALEELSGRKTPPSALTMLSMLGAETDDDREFVRVCRSVLVKEEQ